MIKSITVTNPKSESLTLELRNPEPAGLYVQDIEGLGPAKANINSTQLAAIDGGLFSSSRVTERNIVITLGMLESPTIEDARHRTYKFFPIKKQIKFLIETDNLIAEATGYVESHEPVIFSDQETTQISILCPDPFFYQPGYIEENTSDVQKTFEFPFSNESLTENLLEFGVISFDIRANIHYVGDVDTGVKITIHAFGEATNITLYNAITHESMAIDTSKITTLTGQAYGVSDDIIISTVRGDKYARLLRNGVYTNIISALDKNADWFQLSNGDNVFTYTAESGTSNISILFEYRNAYGGV